MIKYIGSTKKYSHNIQKNEKLSKNSAKSYTGFMKYYETYFTPFKNEVKNLLEIGIKDGDSIRMWKDFFPYATIFGIDIKVKIPKEKRISLHQLDQSSTKHLTNFVKSVDNKFDIIIDDGGHTMKQQQQSFKILFKHLAPGGYYIIEDLHTSDIHFTSRNKKHIWGANKVSITTLKMLNNIKDGIIEKTDFITNEEMVDISNNIESVKIFHGETQIKNKYSYICTLGAIKKKHY